MKKLILITLAFLSSVVFTKEGALQAQNAAITDDAGYTADPSAMLDVKSTTKGMLVPRVSTTQRNAISSPANGLLVFDTDMASFYFHDGSSWINLSSGNPSGIWGQSGTRIFLNDTTYNLGIGTQTPEGKLEVKADGTTTPTEAIFGVVNFNGDTVFAVYPEGVRILVADDANKAAGSRSGFAVGGFSLTKGSTAEYLRVTPDSVRVYVEETSGTKAVGSRGGFAVGGFSLTKGTLTNEYLRVTDDSVRVYIDDDYTSTKATGSKGGFAVGGFSLTKGITNDYLFVQDDSTRVYVSGDEGFAIDNIEAGSEGRYMDLTPENYFIGHESGFNATPNQPSSGWGVYNTFLGYQSGRANTNGKENVLIGYRSGYNMNQAHWNVCVGNETGYNLSSNGIENVFIGTSAGRSTTSGMSNVFIGEECGYGNTTGTGNVFVGKSAGGSSGGDNNNFIGVAAGYNTDGTDNVFIGRNAGYCNSTGNSNVAIGNEAGKGVSNDSYTQNVIIGHLAGELTTSNNHVLIGYQAGQNSTYSNSTYIGCQSGITNTSGMNNTAVGYRSLYSNQTGDYNCALGHQALNTSTGNYCTAMGYVSSYANTTANSNTAFGYASLRYTTTGGTNTAIGSWAGPTSSNPTLTNTSALGYNAHPTASNRIAIGNTSVNWIGGQVGWSTYSDGRFKNNIQENVKGLDFIMELRPVTYNWDIEELDNFIGIDDSTYYNNEEMINARQKQEAYVYSGFIAQEVEEASNKTNYNFSGLHTPENENNPYSLSYSEFVVPLVKAVQEQQEIIENLQTEIEELKKVINSTE